MQCLVVIFYRAHRYIDDVVIMNIAKSMLFIAPGLCGSVVLFADDFVMTGDSD